jgi:hypothetical protein
MYSRLVTRPVHKQGMVLREESRFNRMKTQIYECASAGEQTFATTTARSKNASAVGTDAVSFEQL